MTVIYTAGHSNKTIEEFLALLEQVPIEVVVDCRSRPASRFSPQFGKARLSVSLEEAGVNYEWRGNNLGGLEANVDYDATIREYAKRAETENVVVLCSEKDLKNCHRKSKLTPSFKEQGLTVVHLLYGIGAQEDTDRVVPKAPAQDGMF